MSIVAGQTALANDIIDLVRHFGDGSDGTVNLDGTNTYASFLSKSGSTYTMLRNMYANNLTIGGGVTLVTSGYILYIKDTINGSGTIDWGTPNSGSNASGSNGFGYTNGLGATASGAGRLKTNPGGVGGSAPNAQSGIGVTNASGGTINNPYTRLQSASLFQLFAGVDFDFAAGAASAYKSSGGGSGGSPRDLSGEDGAPGGGGASGGIVWICARRWAGNFMIKARGGNGGGGSSGTGSNGDGGNGGHGGAGGVSVLIYMEKTWTGSYDLVGGSGGGGAGPSGGGSSGAAGNTGTTGTYYEIPLA